MVTPAFELLRSGELVDASMWHFLRVSGNWFYAILMATLCLALYIEQKNSAIPVILLLLIGTWLAGNLPAEARFIGYMMVALGFAGVFYNIYRGANR